MQYFWKPKREGPLARRAGPENRTDVNCIVVSPIDDNSKRRLRDETDLCCSPRFLFCMACDPLPHGNHFLCTFNPLLPLIFPLCVHLHLADGLTETNRIPKGISCAFVLRCTTFPLSTSATASILAHQNPRALTLVLRL